MTDNSSAKKAAMCVEHSPLRVVDDSRLRNSLFERERYLHRIRGLLLTLEGGQNCVNFFCLFLCVALVMGSGRMSVHIEKQTKLANQEITCMNER